MLHSICIIGALFEELMVENQVPIRIATNMAALIYIYNAIVQAPGEHATGSGIPILLYCCWKIAGPSSQVSTFLPFNNFTSQ